MTFPDSIAMRVITYHRGSVCPRRSTRASNILPHKREQILLNQGDRSTCRNMHGQSKSGIYSLFEPQLNFTSPSHLSSSTSRSEPTATKYAMCTPTNKQNTLPPTNRPPSCETNNTLCDRKCVCIYIRYDKSPNIKHSPPDTG